MNRPAAAELVAAARAARERAYAPYSGFRVGAALLTAQGDVVTAANVENASYGLAICAERSAVVAAVAAGSRSFQAIAVAGNAYSGFRVGAALLTSQGDVVTAANVENASYGLAICAERSAVVAAVAAGSRRFLSIAVAGNGPDPVTPCGACRQVLREFPSGADLEVLCAGESGDKLLTTTLGALLPESFGPEDLR